MSGQEEIINGLIDIWQEQELIRTLPAAGRSMYPLIKQGDNLQIKFCHPEKLRTGDIIAFRRNDKIIVHRIIKKLPDGYLEKGDLQLRGVRITPDQIIGRALLLNRPLNRLLSALGYLIHRLSSLRPLAKIFLAIPYLINWTLRWKLN